MKQINEIINDIKYDNITDWKAASRQIKLPEYIIRKYKDKVYWPAISSCQKLSMGFINEFKDRVDWDKIIIHQKLSEGFINSNFNRINLVHLIQCQKLSEDFLRLHIKKFKKNCLMFIFQFQRVSENFIEEFCKTKLAWGIVSKYQKLNENFIIKHKKDICFEYLFANNKIKFNKFSSFFVNNFKDKDIYHYYFKKENKVK